MDTDCDRFLNLGLFLGKENMLRWGLLSAEKKLCDLLHDRGVFLESVGAFEGWEENVGR